MALVTITCTWPNCTIRARLRPDQVTEDWMCTTHQLESQKQAQQARVSSWVAEMYDEEELNTITNNKETIMSTDSYIIAGSGTRKLQTATPTVKKWLLGNLLEMLREAKEKHPNLMVMSGMAEGFDKALALAALQLEIPLWAVIPTKSYGRWYWGEHSQDGTNRLHEFETYLQMATKVTYVMEDIHNITSGLYLKNRHANFVRNDFMVENANEFFIYDPSSRGTGDMFASVKRARKPFTLIQLPKEVK